MDGGAERTGMYLQRVFEHPFSPAPSTNFSGCSATRQRRIRRIYLHLLNRNHCLGPVANPQLPEHRRDMGLDGGLRDIQIISDLFVQKPLSQHTQHPELLRRQ